MAGSLLLRQLEIGPMANFIYLVGSAATREVAVIDPAWDVERILDEARREELNITRILITHGHPDHTNGLGALMEATKAKVYLHRSEAEFFHFVSSDLVPVSDGDRIDLGDVAITFVHTPGHTPGSQCFLVQDCLVSGDTLFIGGCGRCDFPGGDPEELHRSLAKLMKLEGSTQLFPGHNYAGQPSSTIADERRANPYVQLDLASFTRHVPGPRPRSR